MRNKIPWSDEIKIELFDLNAKRQNIPTVKHGGAASCCGMFFRGRDWETSQDRGKDEWSKVQRNS